MPDSPAQLTYTTNPLLSPAVLGGLVTVAASIASSFGVHILNDPALQQQLVLVLGVVLTAFAHWMWPHNDGKLSLSAPLSTPAPVDVPIGASVVTVPLPSAPTQTTAVVPLDSGKSTVTVPTPTLAARAAPVIVEPH